jgi:hypothetical protein
MLSRMKTCSLCHQANEAEAGYCAQCGTMLTTEESPAASGISSLPDVDLWRQFIGPHADRYLEQFKKFGFMGEPRFALTWNWPAFVFIPFLWFLYRKMYLYALVYALGPMISAYVTRDITVSVAWCIIAGATANYVYFWHCREQIAEIKKQGWSDPSKQIQSLKEAGGVQPYVIYVGIVIGLAFCVLTIMMVIKLIQDGQLEGEQPPGKSAPARSI